MIFSVYLSISKVYLSISISASRIRRVAAGAPIAGAPGPAPYSQVWKKASYERPRKKNDRKVRKDAIKYVKMR